MGKKFNRKLGVTESIGLIVVGLFSVGLLLWWESGKEERKAHESKTYAQSSFAVELSATTSGDGVQFAAAPAQSSFAVELSATARVSEGKVFVDGKTNFPDGAKLTSYLYCNAFNYMAIAEPAVVQQGSFRAAPVGTGYTGSVLPEGEYTLSVQFTPLGQTESVTAVVGKKGEKLSGKTVETDEFGVLKIARFETKVDVSGAKATEALTKLTRSREAYRSEVEALYGELNGFRHSSEFLEHGFSQIRFAEWKKRAEALRDSRAPDLESQGVGGLVLYLGVRYIGLKDGDDEQTLRAHSQIKTYVETKAYISKPH